MSLEDWKKQRTLLQNHLDWLDKQIAEQETRGEPVKEDVPPPPPTYPSGLKVEADLSREVSQSAESETRANLQGTRYGCIFAGAIIIILVIAAFWVLPYFIYEK